MHQVRTVLLALTLTLALSAPAFAAPGGTADPGASGEPPPMLASAEQAAGTVADRLTLAIMSTLAGVVFVSLVFVARRKES